MLVYQPLFLSLMEGEKERLYLLLELEKFRENHARMPTVFIFPAGNLVFSGIMYHKRSPDYSLRFGLSKQSIEDTWEIKIDNSNASLNFGQRSISDTLLELNAYDFLQS